MRPSSVIQSIQDNHLQIIYVHHNSVILNNLSEFQTDFKFQINFQKHLKSGDKICDNHNCVQRFSK